MGPAFLHMNDDIVTNCEMSGFHHGVVKVFAILGCYAAWYYQHFRTVYWSQRVKVCNIPEDIVRNCYEWQIKDGEFGNETKERNGKMALACIWQSQTTK
jgi:hypothetical protein